MAKTKNRYFDPRDFFPHMDAFFGTDEKAVPSLPANLEELAREQVKAANPAYWMHMGQLMAHSSVSAPWLWYGMMLGTLEAMRTSAKSSRKIERRHKEAVKAMRKFTRHVAGAEAVKPPKSRRKSKKKNASMPNMDALGFANALSEPVGGKADDLKWIAGVGPALEKTLNSLGVYHFDQIANWTRRDIDWINEYLKFSGRIERDNWIEQAKALAKGGWDEYVKVFGKEPR